MSQDDAGANPSFFSFEEIHSFTEEHLAGASGRKGTKAARPAKKSPSAVEQETDHELKFPKGLLKKSAKEPLSPEQEEAPTPNDEQPLSRREIAGLEAALSSPYPNVATNVADTPAKMAPQPELDKTGEPIPDAEIEPALAENEVDRMAGPISGFQMEQYEHRFADMRREMERMAADLRLTKDSVGEFKETQAKRIDDLKREVRQSNLELQQQIQQLEDQLRNSDRLLQKLLAQNRQRGMVRQELLAEAKELSMVSTRQGRELRSLKINLDEQRAQTERRLDALKREVRQGEDDVRDELQRVTDRLGHQKTDRNALASILMEMATRLETGSGVNGLLEELAAPPQE